MNESSTSVLMCQVSLEYLDPGGSFLCRKVNYKNCLIRLKRNERRKIFLDITEKNKSILRQELKFLTIHKRFVTEGKATIKFKENNVTVLISNAPCGQLISFLRHVAIKIVNNKENSPVKTNFLSSNACYTEDISPITKKEYEKAKMKLTKQHHSLKEISSNIKNQCSEKRSLVKAKRNCLLQVLKQSLSDEQTKIIQAVKSGCNIFFTGGAGTGKSHVLKSIIASLPPDVTFATASTGVAACLIGGTTLHQFAGIGKGDGSLDHCLSLASRPNIQAIWKKCQYLIIDEISMVPGVFFEKLEYISRKIRNNERPFGGIQLIICGDFFQLPPVNSSSNLFCFQTEAWSKCIMKMFELQKIYRQSDPVLIDILHNIRLGKVTQEVTKQLQGTAQQSVEKCGILATCLCTHSKESVSINLSKLEELPGEIKTYKAVDTPQALSSLIDKQSRVTSNITLKVGAQVMLLKNLDISNGLVNGARGVVIKFDSDNLPIVQFNSIVHKVQREKFITKNPNGIVLTRVQIPLTLAWAFSIHKSQGLTLDCIELSLSRVFEPGHAYVALSRVKSLDCLRILDFKSDQVWANKEVLKYHKKFKEMMNEL